jgi:peptide/nickel transport system permease protein
MATFIVRRLVQIVFVLLLVSLIAFSLLQIIPGDPAIIMLGSEASPGQIEALRHDLRLDQPLPAQYLYRFGISCKATWANPFRIAKASRV